MNIDALEFQGKGIVGLGNTDNFNETGYLMLYPDVRKAVRDKRFASGLEHYQKHGQYEGRKPDYDEQAYLTLNPDVRKAVAEGKFTTGAAHYVKHGMKEGRKYSLAHLQQNSPVVPAAPAVQASMAPAGIMDKVKQHATPRNIALAAGAGALVYFLVIKK